ncbi:MAG: hypothetical protein ACI9TV_001385 [Sulfurimonas sp.]|jgi:hypothetical protein|uniref:hypothetical protein n=1 Tax=Sulfurimonas sp. TaxID=2022749 RepID=UPI0039E2973A
MIKIEITEDIVETFYNGVKDYIRLDVFSKKDKVYFTQEKIKEIITCKPQNFSKLSDEIKTQIINTKKMKLAFIGSQEKSKNKSGNFNGYNKFSTKHENEYRAYDLAEKLNINVCPYCNKNYTYTVIDKSSKIKKKQYTRPDIDHFLPKETYPYFALSIYNLIPSCLICNRTIKGSKPFSPETHLHPYIDSFNDIHKFSTSKPLSMCNKATDFDITFDDASDDADLLKKAKNNIQDFVLLPQYNKHKDIVLELKEKQELYNQASISSILSDTEVFRDRDETYLKGLLMGTSLEDKDINKRPLSKLIKDISEELDLL